MALGCTHRAELPSLPQQGDNPRHEAGICRCEGSLPQNPQVPAQTSAINSTVVPHIEPVWVHTDHTEAHLPSAGTDTRPVQGRRHQMAQPRENKREEGADPSR